MSQFPITNYQLPRFHGKRWTYLWLLLLLVQLVLLNQNAALDTYLWRATRWLTGDQDQFIAATYHAANPPTATAPFFERLPSPFNARLYHRTENFWRLFRDMGEPYIVLGVMALLFIYHPLKRAAPLILLASAALAGGIGALIAVIAGRYRPIITDGLNSWQFLRGFAPHAGDLSWPSGHSTLSFAIAASLSLLSPKGRWFFYTLASLTALTRVVMQAHFYSDILFGALLGATLGHLITTLLLKLTTVPQSRLHVATPP